MVDGTADDHRLVDQLVSGELFIPPDCSSGPRLECVFHRAKTWRAHICVDNFLPNLSAELIQISEMSDAAPGKAFLSVKSFAGCCTDPPSVLLQGAGITPRERRGR